MNGNTRTLQQNFNTHNYDLFKHLYKSGGGNFTHALRTIGKSTIYSLLLSSVIGFSACTDSNSTQDLAGQKPLALSVGLAGQPARAIIEENTLPEGSEIGLFLTDDGGSTYDGTSYTNVKYTATGTGASQTWDADTDIMLSATSGTLHAYYPYNNSVTSIQAVPVEAASLTDYMYATSVSGLSVSSNEAQITMNHALTAIKLTLTRGTYSGTGKVTNLSVTSDALATAASLDATTGELSAISGAGTALAHDTDLTLTESPQSTVVTAVPTSATETVTIKVTLDNKVYAATASASSFEQGKIYEFPLTIHNEALIIGDVNINPWNTVTKDQMTMKLYQTYDLATAANGVYAVTKDGLGVKTELADESCIAVALITDNQRIWIEKYENQGPNQAYAKANDSYESTNDYDYYFSWGGYGTDQSGIKNYSSSSGVKADFSGKANSEVIKTILDNGTGDNYYTPMGVLLNTFNASDNADNFGYTDWYIPAAGQSYEMYSNRTAVNNTLTAIGGITIASNYYWSSSEGNSDYGWRVYLRDGSVDYYNKDNDYYRVRVVRDIAPTITFTIADVQYTAIQGWTWQQWVNSKFNVDGYYIGEDDSIFEVSAPNYIHNVTSTDIIVAENSYSLKGAGGSDLEEGETI